MFYITKMLCLVNYFECLMFAWKMKSSRNPADKGKCHAAVVVLMAILPYMALADNLDLSRAQQINIVCNNNNIKDMIPITNRTMRTSHVNIIQCHPSNETYVNVSKSFNIIADPATTRLSVSLLPKTRLEPFHLEGLRLKQLNVTRYNGTGHIYVNGKIFEALASNLEKVLFENVVLSLISESNVTGMVLKNGRSTGQWGGCSNLQQLELEAWEVPAVDEEWLAHCTKLKELVLKHMTRASIERVVTGARTLTRLIIKDSLPFEITDNFLVSATKLKVLRFVGTKIENIQTLTFKSQTELEELEFNDTKILNFEINRILQPLQALRKLTLDNNNLKVMCMLNRYSTLPATLQRVSMKYCKISFICFDQWNTLEYLNLYGNKLTYLLFWSLPYPHLKPVTVDLRNNPFREFVDSEDLYNSIVDRYGKSNNLTLLMNVTLNCDCEHAWFAKIFRTLPHVKVEHARCTDGLLLEHVPPEQLECDRFQCAGCICRRPWNENSTSADCNKANLYAIPRIQNLRRLLARRNVIDSLHVEDFPDSLKWIDLRDNRIARVNAEVMTAILDDPDRRVLLSGNPIICDCENVQFLKILQGNRMKIMDYSNLTCVENGTRIEDLTLDSLCINDINDTILVILTSCAAILILLIVAAVIYYRYKNQIKLYLYIRGCCLGCVREEELDVDREFDAFVSFSHEDKSFINEELLPRLEKVCKYNLCVHTRNWIPGETIPGQIIESVNNSRRTLIVLSRNFVRSVWGMLEFRTAYVSALEEKRARVIIIVLDDVLDDEHLNPEMRNYLRVNTYVMWKDPWLWEKVQYALPHRSAELKQRLSSKGSSNTELVQYVENMMNMTVRPQSGAIQS